jgi:hypothetical protein
MATGSQTAPHIVLSIEQVRVLRDAKGEIELRDPQGAKVGCAKPQDDLHGWTEEDIRLAKEALAAPGPRYTTEQVLAHLRSLEPQ